LFHSVSGKAKPTVKKTNLVLLLSVLLMLASPLSWADSSANQPLPKSHDAVLLEDGHYVNTDGNVVHSPSHTKDDVVPDGATAKCRDGTYSFSLHHRGTCSHHGGVMAWL
jgi:hypothetical protein